MIGLLCAAFGRPRWESVEDLAAPRLGVRVDREGPMKLAFHTAGGGTINGKPYGAGWASGGVANGAGTSIRYYIADPNCVVAFEGDTGLLPQLSDALDHRLPHARRGEPLAAKRQAANDVSTSSAERRCPAG